MLAVAEALRAPKDLILYITRPHKHFALKFLSCLNKGCDDDDLKLVFGTSCFQMQVGACARHNNSW